MTDQSLPTRSQLNGALEFFASFAGSAYDEERRIDIPIADEERLGSHLRVEHGRTIIRIPERALQESIEEWIRQHWTEVVDYMVDSECALEDPEPIEDKPCDREDAHGPHYWTEHQFAQDVEFHCEGLSVHPRCMIAGGRNAD